MPIPKPVARFNRHVTNPLARLVAGWAPGFAIVRHRGRKSGKVYSTPINIFEDGDGFVAALTYGSDVDWLKNVAFAGGCTIRHRNRDIDLIGPVRVDSHTGLAKMPPVVRAILGVIDVTEFVEFHRPTNRPM